MRLLALKAGLAASVFAGVTLAPAPAHAQTTYGAWVKTSDCQVYRPRGGLFRGPEVPGVPSIGGGYQQTQECRWERTVRKCPRIFASMRECSERKERSDHSVFRPRD